MALTSITPAVAGLAGGTRCFLSGSGLGSATGVTFDGVPGTEFVIVSASFLYVTAPAHAAGAVDVVVTVGLGTLTAGFTYQTTTRVSAITGRADPFSVGSWTAAAAAWGSAVYTGDSGAQAVAGHTGPVTFLEIEGGPLDDGIIPLDATIEEIHVRFDWAVTLPAGNSVLVVNSIDSTAATVTGTSSGTAVSGIQTGGTWADWTGVGLQTFGFRFESDASAQAGGSTRLVITNFQILVTYTGGTPIIPVVTSVSPVEGYTTGGTLVTITGTGFPVDPVVRFGAVAATAGVTRVDATAVTARAPAHARGPVTVTVAAS